MLSISFIIQLQNIIREAGPQGTCLQAKKPQTIIVLLHVNCSYVPLFDSHSGSNIVNYKAYSFI